MNVQLLQRPSPSHSRRRSDAGQSFRQLAAEAKALLAAAPELTLPVIRLIDEAASFEVAVARHLAHLLSSAEAPGEALLEAFRAALAAEPRIGAAMRADAHAVIERDPAAGGRLIQPVLFFKGYHALETHRLAHALWRAGRRELALYLQSRSSERFGTDIHPAVRLGERVLLDHATGFTAGETAVIEDDVSILQGVTLGGTGTAARERHPKVRRGVLLGAGAMLLGPIEVGANARVAAGSLVVNDVVPGTTVAGVPARPVGKAGASVPAHAMDQMLGPEAYEAFTYVI